MEAAAPPPLLLGPGRAPDPGTTSLVGDSRVSTSMSDSKSIAGLLLLLLLLFRPRLLRSTAPCQSHADADDDDADDDVARELVL